MRSPLSALVDWENMTKDQARSVLDYEFGNKDRFKRFMGIRAGFAAGVMKAIETLGGQCQASWGCTRYPEEW